MGERRVRNAKVEGSIPFRSTIERFTSVTQYPGNRATARFFFVYTSPQRFHSLRLLRNFGGNFDSSWIQLPGVTAMLTLSAVANAKPQAKPYKLADKRGMYLL